MVVANYYVSAIDEDAQEKRNNTNFWPSDTRVIMVSDAEGSQYDGGFVFVNCTIPQGATINHAYLHVNVWSVSYDDPNLDIYGNDVDNANDFTAEADIENRTKTTATVEWVATDLGTGWKTSPDIASVIQEIVDRGGWASGNQICLLLMEKASASAKYFRVWAYDGDTELAAYLEVDYTAGAGGLSIPVAMHHYGHHINKIIRG